MFQSKAQMSNVWRGITENAHVLNEGMKMSIGNGENTLFWDHKWATDKPLSNLATQEIPQDIAGATVAEMWTSNEGWKWDQIADLLPAEVIQQIDSFEVKEDPDMADLVFWQHGNKGQFTIKSALSIIRKEQDLQGDQSWKIIWKTSV